MATEPCDDSRCATGGLALESDIIPSVYGAASHLAWTRSCYPLRVDSGIAPATAAEKEARAQSSTRILASFRRPAHASAIANYAYRKAGFVGFGNCVKRGGMGDRTGEAND